MKRIKTIICMILALVMVLTGFSPLQAESVSAMTKKNGLNKTQVTMYPGESVKLSVNGAKNVKWKSSNVKTATVSKKGTVTAKKGGSAKITATVGKKTYSCKVTIKKKPAVTRGEWIAALLKQTGIKTSKISSYHFSDTKQYRAGKVIETAYCRDIIPIKKGTKNFYPNRPATREFMAVTAVRAMGFKADTSEKPKCSDKGKLKYAAEDQIAINQKMISLKKGKFLPSNAITASEKKKALAAINKIQKAEQVNHSHKDMVKYQTGVVEQPLKSENDYTVSASGSDLIVTIPINDNTQKIQKGKVIVLPQKTGSQDRVALKVNSVSDDGNGNYYIVGETPDISDLYKKIDVQNVVQTDMAEFQENSAVVASATTSSNNGVSLLGASQTTVSTTVGEATTLQLKETKLGSAGSVKGSVELSAPKVSAIVDADFSNPLKPVYNQVTIALEEDVTAKATLKFSSKGSGAEKIYLGHVTASLGYGLFVDVLCYLNISAEGEATVQYTLANEVRASYINGDFRMDANSDGSWEGTKAEITGQVLGEPQVNLRVLGYWFDDKLYGAIPVIGVQADFGPKFKASVKVHDTTPKTCSSLSIYAYLSVGINTDSGLGKFLKKNTKLKLSKTIWDDNAGNPLRAAWHYEDGVRTEGDVCTYKKDEKESSKDNVEKMDFKDIVGDYSFDSELYYKKNGTGPVIDFGSQFSKFEPYLTISEDKRISYYFSYEGGDGTCELNGDILSTKIYSPNYGNVNEKMKIKQINGYFYIIQVRDGKTIYWKKSGSLSKKELNQKAHQAFMKQIKEDKKNYIYGDGQIKYLFIDLDGDEIDELITYPGYGFISQVVYDYKNGKVIEAGNLSHCEIQSFYVESNVIYASGAQMGTAFDAYYKFKNGKLSEIAVKNEYWYDLNGNLLKKPTYDTYINEKKVSRTRFQKYVKTLTKGKQKDFSKIKWKEY